MSRFRPLTEEEFQALAGAFDSELQALLDGQTGSGREAILGVVDKVEHLHAEGWRRLLEAAGRGGWADRLAAAVTEDPVLTTLLLACGLLEPGLAARVEMALDRTRPYLRSHGGDVELVGIENGVVRVRLVGACQGCPASSMTLRHVVEQAIVSSVPEIEGLEVVTGEGEPLPSGATAFPVQVEEPAPAGAGELPADTAEWVAVARFEEVPADRVLGVELGDLSAGLVRVGDAVRAFVARCPHADYPLGDAPVRGGRWVTCPGHGYGFDAVTGACNLDPDLRLEFLDVRVEAGRVWLRALARLRAAGGP